ncbi:MAG: hypothetical protein HY074_18625 [Deltaproteobacteria bacterium]|nr:hypothetical protein [Deltaproteobacteria bacterium]
MTEQFVRALMITRASDQRIRKRGPGTQLAEIGQLRMSKKTLQYHDRIIEFADTRIGVAQVKHRTGVIIDIQARNQRDSLMARTQIVERGRVLHDFIICGRVARTAHISMQDTDRCFNVRAVLQKFADRLNPLLGFRAVHSLTLP